MLVGSFGVEVKEGCARVLVGRIGAAVGVLGVAAAINCVGVGLLCNDCRMIGPTIAVMITPHRVKSPVITATHIAIFDFEVPLLSLMMITSKMSITS